MKSSFRRARFSSKDNPFLFDMFALAVLLAALQSSLRLFCSFVDFLALCLFSPEKSKLRCGFSREIKCAVFRKDALRLFLPLLAMLVAVKLWPR